MPFFSADYGVWSSHLIAESHAEYFSRSYGHCNQAGPSHSSQVESEFLERSKVTDLPPTESGKNATTLYNGLEVNVNDLEWWMRRLFLRFPRLGGRESSASLQFWASTDWVFKERLEFQLKNKEIRTSTNSSTGLPIPTNWISCAKPSSARPSHTLHPCPLLPLLLYLPHFLATISIVLILRFPSQASANLSLSSSTNLTSALVSEW